MAAISATSLTRSEPTQCTRCAKNSSSAMLASFVILRTIISPTGHVACNVMMDIIDTITASVTGATVAMAILAAKCPPPACDNKDFKPCQVHGDHTKHSYKECRANPHNQIIKSCTNNSNKHAHSHHESHNQHVLATQAATMSCTVVLTTLL